MATLEQVYTDYLINKDKVEREYNDRIRDIKNQKIENCRLKKGMIIKFHKWTGRIIFVDFVGALENQTLQVMLLDSETITRVPISEKDFDRIRILEEPKALNMQLIKESIARLEKEEESYKIAIENITKLHDNRMVELVKDVKLLRKDCIHDWKMISLPENDDLKSSSDLYNPTGYSYECVICKDSRVRL